MFQEGEQRKSWIVRRLVRPRVCMLAQGVFGPVQVAFER
jgi:hypothetical protein